MPAADRSEAVMEDKTAVTPEAQKEYLKQAQSLSLNTAHGGLSEEDDSFAKKAKFITPNDAVLETTGGDRLPAVPVEEAEKLNELEAKVHAEEKAHHGLEDQITSGENVSKEGVDNDSTARGRSASKTSPDHQGDNVPLGSMQPPKTTHPLFPPLPVYGPPSLTRNLHCYVLRTSSFIFSIIFLGTIFACGIATGLYKQLISGERAKDRPFYEEEIDRQRTREAEEKSWHKRQRRRASVTAFDDIEEAASQDSYIPTEGGKDILVCDVAYYARRVGLDMEGFKVQTEDGFIIDLWHIYNPKEYAPKSSRNRGPRGPDVFKSVSSSTSGRTNTDPSSKRKYPILMIHGLLQSSGAYCTTDDNSLAFYLAKSNYDVWLGNNRCGFNPQHSLLSYGDPRMWNWNIRQMGVLDLPALISRVLYETGFPKLGLVGHSQGTTQTLVALAKSQRPALGDKISVFCALAPAAYAGPLLNRWMFKFFRTLNPAMYKIAFGMHAFMPMMMNMQKLLPPKFFGKTGYMTMSYMFHWSDRNWDRGLRDRCFQFAPVYVSAEAMRWWLGRDCFSKQKCILATEEEWKMEDVDDDVYDAWALGSSVNRDISSSSFNLAERKLAARKEKAWYDEHSPPMAFWVAGSDDLVDGRRLLRRLGREKGREPCVRVVRQKVIENYEHLDVIWAVDSLEQVGRGVKECVWETCPVRDEVMVPVRCEEVGVWVDPGPVEVVKEGGGEAGIRVVE